MTLWTNGVPRPDHGPGMVQIVCADCGAGWVGPVGDPCAWCADRLTHDVADTRRVLLWPDWLAEQGPRYDELGELDRAVWDRTRGIVRGADSLEAWRRRLAEAVAIGLVTRDEAHGALARARRAAA